MTHAPDPTGLDPELRWLGAPPPPPAVLVLATPVVLAFGAAALALGMAGAAWRAVKQWTVPDEAFVGCWTNDDIERLPERPGKV